MQSKLSDLVHNLLETSKKNVWNERENVNSLDLKMIDYITDAKIVKKDVLSQKID